MGLYADQLTELHAAIAAVDGGDTYTIGPRVYGAADLDELYAREELVSVQAAIQAIQEGSQSYTIHGRSFTLGDLEALYKQRDAARVRLQQTQSKRTGIRLRRGVHE